MIYLDDNNKVNIKKIKVLWCCVAGCINWEYGHIFPKDPALKNWNGRWYGFQLPYAVIYMYLETFDCQTADNKYATNER
jgi:hypothetical protein